MNGASGSAGQCQLPRCTLWQFWGDGGACHQSARTIFCSGDSLQGCSRLWRHATLLQPSPYQVLWQELASGPYTCAFVILQGYCRLWTSPVSGSVVTAAVRPTPEDPRPVVLIARGDTFMTARRSCDLATPAVTTCCSSCSQQLVIFC